jgi:glutaredoxin
MKKVSLYTLSTCPWCRKTKRFFMEHDVPFDYTDYDLADEATQQKIVQEMDEHGATGFPYVKIDGEVVSGYNPSRYAELLGLATESA